MRASSFNYLVKHGFQSLWLNRLMTIASVGILSACLIVTGLAGIVGLGVADMFGTVESRNEITVYIQDELDDAGVLSLRDSLKGLEGVAELSFTSKEQAFEQVRQSLGDDAELLEGLDPDFLPASYTVTLQSSRYMKDTVAAIEKLPGVLEVRALLDVADTLSNLGRALLIVGGAIAAILVVVSVVVISNAIRMSVFARRREISIMKYVGATNRFIRLPFRVEGATIGLVAALLAFLVVFGIYALIGSMSASSDMAMIASFIAGVPFNKIWYYLLTYNVVFGVFLGSVASTASMRKYLRV